MDYIQGIDGVRSVNASKSVADSFASFGRLLSYVSLAIIIILVGVALDTVKQMESQMMMRHYKGFLE